jgi:D-tyrosyl-tRNA(Tyr) deacylase
VKLVIQRVNHASVKNVDSDKVVGKINHGLFVLVGIKKGDTIKEVEALATKLSKLRILSDSEDKMNLSVLDKKEEVLIVSQFTLIAETKGQNRPSFIEAALPEEAKKIYEHFIGKVKEKGIKVETGSFGDYMEIEASLDGPVTICLEA